MSTALRNMAARSLFLDANVLIDLLLQRPQELVAINKIFSAARDGQLKLYLSESVICTAVYVCKISNDTSAIEAVLRLAEVLALSKTTVLAALRSSFKDKEDAILYNLAASHGIDFFVTRNKKDFRNHANSATVVMSPGEFVRHHNL